MQIALRTKKVDPLNSDRECPERRGWRGGYRIVVVGAGLVGLLLAILLRQAGYPVTVLEEDTHIKDVIPRTISSYSQTMPFAFCTA